MNTVWFQRGSSLAGKANNPLHQLTREEWTGDPRFTTLRHLYLYGPAYWHHGQSACMDLDPWKFYNPGNRFRGEFIHSVAENQSDSRIDISMLPN